MSALHDRGADSVHCADRVVRRVPAGAMSETGLGPVLGATKGLAVGRPIRATVYLLHFTRPYKHAKHYVGFTAAEGLDERIARHRAGTGARLIAVILDAGIDFVIARVWHCSSVAEAREREKKLKYRGNLRTCPLCRAGK